MRIADLLKRNRLNIYLLLLVAGIVSIPLMTGGIPVGTNIQASLSRIEAIRDGIGKAFPIRLVPLSSYDYVYGARSFQADIFLVIPALFRMLGMGVSLSYKVFLILINLVTACVAYFCFGKMFKRNEIGIVGSMLYTWCPYRVSDLYINANVGEGLAWAFLPIVLLGMMKLFSFSEEEKQYGSIWMTLTIGLSLLLNSSVTFFFVAAGMMLLMLLVMGKSSLRKKPLICIGKAVLATTFLNGWFLFPMLLRMTDASVVGPMIAQNFRMRGMYLTQYLSIFPTAGDELDFMETGAVNAQAMGVGAAVVLLVLFYVWALFLKKFEDKLGRKILLVSLILIVLSCSFFPWDLLQNKNMLCSVILAFLQSPAKWGVAACVGLIWIACRMLYKLWEQGHSRFYWTILAVTAAISFVIMQLMTSRILNERTYMYPDNEEWGNLSMQILMNETIAWRLCEIVSAVTWCFFLTMWVVRRKRNVQR